MKSVKSNIFAILLFLVVSIVIGSEVHGSLQKRKEQKKKFETYLATEAADSTWQAPSLYCDVALKGAQRDLVIYGQQLIAHTAVYLGPKGTVARITNGMNCQNCHLDAGTRPWGNNYGAVYATYPQMRSRSGNMQDIYDRINDCLQRSLNGSAMDTSCREMKAIQAYISWLGITVPKGRKPYGAGLPRLPFLPRAADPVQGQIVYRNNCQSCHGDQGQGVLAADNNEYTYPPLWGEHSYNDGAGLYRLTKFASFVYNNMPYNQAAHSQPSLSIEDAWDVAAFVNSQYRPHLDQHNDWPDLGKKSYDAPFGPYADEYSEQQHKYGPYQPLIYARKTR
ncbi:c-type cytochrome [Chitinophaga pendula]|uniref:c-type cytochrome n=1 Tax=Chitinophaga TaxID=79328 RepID=UPI000BB0BEBC|nr:MULTISPECIES: c-type cytochrome [Chitinophaga]ASZ11917.1 cytochrome C [Chitinophaga sp. MD30]UCJ05055.1 c-type cytochrome [Chitinophaga pendula]